MFGKNFTIHQVIDIIIEDQIMLERQGQPDIVLDLMFELAGSPAGMTEGDKEDGCGGAVQCFVMTTNRLDRCIAAHSRPDEQNLFAIIQGGLDENLRRKCLDEMIKRDLPGYAIGGLSGGEAKVRPRRQFNLSRSSCAMVVDSAR